MAKDMRVEVKNGQDLIVKNLFRECSSKEVELRMALALISNLHSKGMISDKVLESIKKDVQKRLQTIRIHDTMIT